MNPKNSRKRMNEFYSDLFLTDLTQGTGIWKNVENVTRVTFKSFHDILVKQNKQILLLNKSVKGLKREVKHLKKRNSESTTPEKPRSAINLDNNREVKMYRSFILTQNSQKRMRTDLNQTNQRLEEIQLKLEKNTISKSDFSQLRRSKVDKTVFRKQLSSEYKQFELLLKNRLEAIKESWRREYSDDVAGLVNNLKDSVGEEMKKGRVQWNRHEELIMREINSLKEKILSNLLKVNEFHKEYIDNKEGTKNRIIQIHDFVNKKFSKQKQKNSPIEEHKVFFDEKIESVVLRKIMEDGILNKYCQNHVVPMFSKEIQQHLTKLFSEMKNGEKQTHKKHQHEIRESQDKHKQEMNEWKDEISKSIQNIMTFNKIETNNFTQEIVQVKERIHQVNKICQKVTHQQDSSVTLEELKKFSSGIQHEIKRIVSGIDKRISLTTKKIDQKIIDKKCNCNPEELKIEFEEIVKTKFEKVKEKVIKMQESIRQLIIINTSRNILPNNSTILERNNEPIITDEEEEEEEEDDDDDYKQQQQQLEKKRIENQFEKKGNSRKYFSSPNKKKKKKKEEEDDNNFFLSTGRGIGTSRKKHTQQKKSYRKGGGELRKNRLLVFGDEDNKRNIYSQPNYLLRE